MKPIHGHRPLTLILRTLLWKGLITKARPGVWEIHPRVFDMDDDEAEELARQYLEHIDNN